MTRHPFSIIGFFCVLGVTVAVLFFSGPVLERTTAAFLFSKIRYAAGAFALGSPWVWGRYSGVQAPLQASREPERGVFPMRAAVIFRPPSIPYDQIIIDRGERDGVRLDMAVTADGIFIGRVSEVFWDSSRVISPTSFGREYDVVLEGSKTAVTAVGAGNRELWIRLPREFPVAEGERVLTVGTHRYVVGVVARIVGETSSAIKEARIRQPLNVRSLLDVYVVE
ncbi:MAG: hypothetical protein HYS44_02740 [Candidatus Niyogibacteria bacterium]|nr:hypothetical protein [Candidatus Niyogibacteria bacterium]